MVPGFELLPPGAQYFAKGIDETGVTEFDATLTREPTVLTAVTVKVWATDVSPVALNVVAAALIPVNVGPALDVTV
jgi:hypothetical protein